jgi:hypothetical protein
LRKGALLVRAKHFEIISAHSGNTRKLCLAYSLRKI